MKIITGGAKKPQEKKAAVSRIETVRNAAAVTARQRTVAWKDSYMSRRFTKWDDIKVHVPDQFKALQFNLENLSRFCGFYIDSQKVLVSSPIVPEAKATDIKTVSVELGPIKLRPQQQKAVNECLNTWPRRNGFVFPLQTGQGKTMIAAAIIKHLQVNRYYNLPVVDTPWPKVFYFTKSSVVEKAKRELKRVGILGVGQGTIQVVGHDSLNAKAMAGFFVEGSEKRFNSSTKIYTYALPPPAVIVIDECHAYKNPESKKCKKMEALVRAVRDAGGIILFTSATPYVTVEDTWLLSYSLGMKWQDERVVDWYSFSAFARQVAHPALPSQAVAESIKRYNKAIGSSFIKPPNDPSKIKAFNSVKLLDWVDDDQRKKYLAAEHEFLEAKRRIGESTDNMDMAAFTIFRAREEYLKMPNFADWMLESAARGKAPVACVCFQDSLRKLVLDLIDRGVRREDISLVWGGRREIKADEILSTEEFAKCLTTIAGGGDLEKKIKTRFLKTQRFWQERIKLGETETQQLTRNSRLQELRLHSQSLPERQREIDAFQDGRTKYCIFTMSAGGAGLDLDQQSFDVLPRELISTICYYGEEFLQAFGRIKRLSTVSNVNQFMAFFRGSIAATHVAPRLTKKLAAIGATTNAGGDLVALLDNAENPPPAEDLEKIQEDSSEVNDDLLEDIDDDDDNDKDEE